MNRLCSFTTIAVLLAATGALAAPQPLVPTAPGTALLPNSVYEIVYAVSGFVDDNQQTTPSETVVTVGHLRTAPTTCRVQVQWIDWDGTSVGVSGPASIPIGGSLEFTTRTAPFSAGHFVQNVFRENDKPFEGYARVRTTCPVETTFRIDATVYDLTFNAGGGRPSVLEYEDVKVVRLRGNVGD